MQLEAPDSFIFVQKALPANLRHNSETLTILTHARSRGPDNATSFERVLQLRLALKCETIWRNSRSMHASVRLKMNAFLFHDAERC